MLWGVLIGSLAEGEARSGRFGNGGLEMRGCEGGEILAAEKILGIIYVLTHLCKNLLASPKV